MNRHNLLSRRGATAWIALLCVALGLAPAAHAVPAASPAVATPNPLAKLDPAQRRVVQQLLKKRQAPGEGQAQADSVELADIDGDGKPDIVLLWTLLGPTFASSSVTLVSRLMPPSRAGGDAGGWRETARADVFGQAVRLRVQGREIVVDTLTLGPKDARCCPSVRQVQRLRWLDGRLVAASG